MTPNQLFFAMGGLFLTGGLGSLAFIKYYLDAKIDGVHGKFDGVDTKFDGVNSKLDGIARNVDMLVTFMIDHNARIAVLEEKTKKL